MTYPTQEITQLLANRLPEAHELLDKKNTIEAKYNIQHPSNRLTLTYKQKPSIARLLPVGSHSTLTLRYETVGVPIYQVRQIRNQLTGNIKQDLRTLHTQKDQKLEMFITRLRILQQEQQNIYPTIRDATNYLSQLFSKE